MASIYRADQIGSLLRPPELLEARAAYTDGRIDLEQRRFVEDQAILDTLKMQRAAGIDVFTDGEYRRRDFRTNFAEALEGFVEIANPIDWNGPKPGSVAPTPGWYVGATLKQRHRISGHESSFLNDNAGGPYKICIPSPGFMAGRSYQPGVTDAFYPTPVHLLHALADIVRGEIKALADEGVPYVQLDAPGYTVFMDSRHRQRLQDSGLDIDQALDESIAADNACLEGADTDRMTIAMHLCRGNNQSHWHSEGGYEPIAERLFGTLQVGTFLLEYDTDRAGGFEPLRFVPRGKNVVLGLVTTKEGHLESPDELLRRIEEAAQYFPIENLAISPQCGFATVSQGNLISWDEQTRKLELVAETARKVWG